MIIIKRVGKYAAHLVIFSHPLGKACYRRSLQTSEGQHGHSALWLTLRKDNKWQIGNHSVHWSHSSAYLLFHCWYPCVCERSNAWPEKSLTHTPSCQFHSVCVNKWSLDWSITEELAGLNHRLGSKSFFCLLPTLFAKYVWVSCSEKLQRAGICYTIALCVFLCFSLSQAIPGYFLSLSQPVFKIWGIRKCPDDKIRSV